MEIKIFLFTILLESLLVFEWIEKSLFLYLSSWLLPFWNLKVDKILDENLIKYKKI